MDHWLFNFPSGCNEYQSVGREDFLAPFRNWLSGVFDKFSDSLGDDKEQFRKNFAANFNANAWHLFLLGYFDACGLPILKSRPDGPDIIVRAGDKEIYVEAVEATTGVSEENRPIDLLDYKEAVNIPFPDPKIKLRLTSTLGYKKNKIDGYLEKGKIPGGAPVVIAVNSCLNYRSLGSGSTNSYMFRTLYSLGADRIHIDRKTLKTVGTDTEVATKLKKFSREKGSEIEFESRFFQFDEYSNISGVINTDRDTYNLFCYRGKDLELIPNLNATNHLPDAFGPFPHTFVATPNDSGFAVEVKKRDPAPIRLS